MSEEELSIKINICDRYYPLRIDAKEEEGLRKAANQIKERVKYYTEHFSVQDKQDALAMVALEYAVELFKQSSGENELGTIASRLSSLEQLLRSE